MNYIYVDGGALNNQDASKRKAYGSFYVSELPYPNHESTKKAHKTFDFGAITNNQAEYRILIEALKYCINEFIPAPVIYSDSALVVNQLAGHFKTNEPSLVKLKDMAEQDIKLIDAVLVKLPREEIVKVLGH